MTYRYDHFTPAVVREELAALGRAPRPGDPLPRFELPTTEGGTFRVADWIGRRPLVVVTASIT